MGQALELYQHATRIAPADPDTHRLYASRILQFFESDAMGAEHVCGAEQSLQTAMSLESNPRRIDEIRELIPAARQACEKVGKQNWLFTKGMEIWSILAGTVMSSLIVVTLIAIASGALEKTFVQQKFSTAMRMSSMHGTLMEGKKTASAAESASLDADDVKVICQSIHTMHIMYQRPPLSNPNPPSRCSCWPRPLFSVCAPW